MRYTGLLIGATTIEIKEYCGKHYWTVTLSSVKTKASSIPTSVLLSRGRCKELRHAEYSAIRFIQNSLSLDLEIV